MTPEEVERYNRQLYPERYRHKSNQGQESGKTVLRIMRLAVILATIGATCYCANLAARHFSDKARREEAARREAQAQQQAAQQRELEKQREFEMAVQRDQAERERQFAAQAERNKQILGQRQAEGIGAQADSLEARRQAWLAAQKRAAQTAAPPAPPDNSELARALEAARQANEMTRGIAAPRDASVSAKDSTKGGALALAQAKLPKGATVTQTKFNSPGTKANYWTCYIYFK